MPHVSPTLPNDGESADAVDISGPFLELLAVFNGHIGADNLEPGTIVAAIGTGDITADKIAASAVTTGKIADKAITPGKVADATSVTTHTSNTLTPSTATRMFICTALTGNATIAAPSGTPADGQALIIRIKDNGTIRTLTWDAVYRAVGLTLPTATVANKMLYASLLYNSAAGKWDVIGLAREA